MEVRGQQHARKNWRLKQEKGAKKHYLLSLLSKKLFTEAIRKYIGAVE